jgi:PAS domain S-box-containing protein
VTTVSRSIERFSLRVVFCFSLLIALLPPVSYFLVSYQYLRGVIDVKSELSAHSVSEIVRSNPKLWRFETLRLSEMLERVASDDVAEMRRIHDEKHNLLARNNVTVSSPLITRVRDIYDAGLVVAHIEVSRSLIPLLKKSALIAIFSLALAASGFYFFRTIPAKSIKMAYHALGESENKYRSLYESMREGEERYRALFNQAGEGILIMSKEGKIIDVNESFCSMHGFSKEEMLSINISDLDRHGGVNEVPERTQLMLAGQSLSFEVEHYHKDGHVIPLEVSANLITYGGGFNIQSFHRDITERKRTEEERSKLEAQLQQAQKMESIGRLAGGVAHDFNNLLTVISGYSQLGLMESVPGQPIHEFFITILKAAEKSADLTRQLLAFARKQAIEPKVLYLNETVAGMLKLLQRLIGEDIHLLWQPAPSLWPIEVDPSQIDQILANLCVNARDSITGAGKITIVTNNSLIDEAYSAQQEYLIKPGGYVRLTISDDGCGMDKDTASRIFEPFFTTKELGKGTGLGLSTVYGIVKQNNGFINVESEQGIGTSFSIYLPRYEGDSTQMMEEDSTESAPRGQETVLLVEDEMDILNMAAIILEKQGYNVLPANTPGEAADLARKHSNKIHLLITDVVMPEMNGRDLADNLKADYPHLKCLFMSGYTADVIAHQGVLAEGINFIQKPFSLLDLATKVREVLENED